jgi:hypothetical protein
MNLFYYDGKEFDNEEEWKAYIKQWPDQPLDLEGYRLFLDQRYREAECNLSINPNFSTKTAYKLLRINTDWTEDKN